MELLPILESISGIIWGYPLIVLLLGTGIYFTVRLGLLQVRRLGMSLALVTRKHDPHALSEKGDISPFAALCTALSATIGTGNIVGVATAVAAGGPGAIFWMWIAAFFGMTTKYAECLLAIKYRTVDANGDVAGGPMYYIELGMKKSFFSKWLARAFAFFGIIAACLGLGTFAQVNALTQASATLFDLPIIVFAVILTTVVAMVTLGGLKSISRVAEKVVPFMALFYIIACVIILIANAEKVLPTINFIIDSAFNPQAAFGAGSGILVMQVMKTGVARGIFSNEAGLGSAPIAAAAAKTNSCVEQGLLGMTGVFIDSIIICTMTGIVLVLTGAWNSGAMGVHATNLAFNSGMASIAPNVGQYVVSIGLIFFAFTTILGWNYYGERCVDYLFGVKAILPYRLIFIALVAIGPFVHLNVIWTIADIANGLMAFPNLIALLALSGVVISETKLYFDDLNEKNKTS